MEERNIIKEQKVKYASTIAKEFELNFSPLKKEKLISQWKVNNNCAFIITNCRVIFLKHRILGPDKLLYVPLKNITKIYIKSSFFTMDKIVITYPNGKIKFFPWAESIGLLSSFKMGALGGVIGTGGAVGGMMATSVLKKYFKKYANHIIKDLKPHINSDVLDQNSISEHIYLD